MKLSVFFLFATFFGLQANTGYAQKTKVTLELENVTVERLLDEIENKTEFLFVYKSNDVDLERLVSVKADKATITSILNQVFGNSPTGFNVINKQIFLTQKDSILVPKEETSMIQDPIQVTGKVTDKADVPLIGVTVRISGTNKGVVTDFEGKYAITVPSAESVLVFSSIGYATKEFTVGGQTVINVTMRELVSELDEVVLSAGYYKTSRREATGSIAKVDAKAIEKQPVSNPVATLHGRMPGVQITQGSGVAGSGIKIQIRGQNSLRRAGNEPLFIIDGIPFSTQSSNSSFVSGGLFPAVDRESPLNSINPADIESIEVLKDADATAIYGSRGANGVVLITTKRGKAGKTKLDVNMYSGFSNVVNTMDMMNSEQYLEMRREAVTNDGLGDFLDDPNFASFWPDIAIWDPSRTTDWQEELIGGTAHTNSIQASISGGNESTQFLFSGGYYNETTVFPGDFNYQKLSSHLRVTHTSHNKRFKFNGSVSYVADKNNNIGEDFTSTALNLAPNAPAIYDDEGNLNWENFQENPLALLERTYLGRTNNLISNVVVEYELLKGLTAKANLGYNTLDFDELKLTPTTIFDPSRGFGSEFSTIDLNNTRRESLIVEPQLNWEQTIWDGTLNILIGGSFQENKRNGLVVNGVGFPDNSMITNIGAASNVVIRSNAISEYKYAAFFGRINYNYDGKYIVNATGRRDGSSRFGPDKQFANFMAVGAAWIFSEENFLKDNEFLSFGKLRASYGSTGSDQIGDYQFLDSFTISGTDYDGVTSLLPTQLFNDDFAWEVNRKLEFGLNLGLWNDAVLLNIAYYRNRSSNQLVGLPLSNLTGFTSVQSNFPATVQNTGLELELNTTNIRKGDFIWKSGFNITIPKNKLVAFPNLEQSDSYRNTLIIGEPINIRQLYESTGVDPDTGAYIFRDFNDDGVIDREDRQIVKSLDPELFGGLSNSLSYKGFQLDFLFQFVKQEGNNFGANSIIPGANFNQPAFYFQNRWQTPGDTATIQRYTFGLNNDALTGYFNYQESDLVVTDASFIRLKNVSLSYTLSEEWTKGFKARLFLQGQNLWTITDYFGLDPENQITNRLPPLRTITLGAQFTF